LVRYPGREDVGRDYKIPSVIWYDKEGNFQAAGAEATREGTEIEAVERKSGLKLNGWHFSYRRSMFKNYHSIKV
jgi:hypothetical protein